ncbi:MAG: hypothetical protein JXJ04_06465 [Spirochaetales bacterium]|nr:hypothetical protein [Spirochaetales bacterium]
MLFEIKAVKQYDNEGYRRWFTDDYFDLIIWYNDDDSVSGFQLCYDKQDSERSVTWVSKKGFSHNKIDAGETPGHAKMSPILVPDGAFDKDSIADKFKAESKEIDKEISAFVYSKLLIYPG